MHVGTSRGNKATCLSSPSVFPHLTCSHTSTRTPAPTWMAYQFPARPVAADQMAFILQHPVQTHMATLLPHSAATLLICTYMPAPRHAINGPLPACLQRTRFHREAAYPSNRTQIPAIARSPSARNAARPLPPPP